MYTLEVQRPLKEYKFSPKTIVLVGNFNHPKLGTIILIVLDFQGIPGTQIGPPVLIRKNLVLEGCFAPK